MLTSPSPSSVTDRPSLLGGGGNYPLPFLGSLGPANRKGSDRAPVEGQHSVSLPVWGARQCLSASLEPARALHAPPREGRAADAQQQLGSRLWAARGQEAPFPFLLQSVSESLDFRSSWQSK